MLKVASFHFVAGLLFLLVTAKPQQKLPLNLEISDAKENELSNQIPTSAVQNTETSSSNAINENLLNKNASSSEEPANGNALLNNYLVINSAIDQFKNSSIENESSPNSNEADPPNELAEHAALNLISLNHVESNSSNISVSKPAEDIIQDNPKINEFLVQPDGSSFPVKAIQSTPSHTNAGSTYDPFLVVSHQNPTKDANSISSDNKPMKPESNYVVIPNSERNLRGTGEALNTKSLLNILGILPLKPEASLLSVSSGVSNFHIVNFKEDPKLQSISELLLAINSVDKREERIN